MKILDGDALPGETVEVDADLKKAAISFEQARAKAARA
jgi:type III secretory pathway component EscV